MKAMTLFLSGMIFGLLFAIIIYLYETIRWLRNKNEKKF